MSITSKSTTGGSENIITPGSNTAGSQSMPSPEATQAFQSKMAEQPAANFNELKKPENSEKKQEFIADLGQSTSKAIKPLPTQFPATIPLNNKQLPNTDIILTRNESKPGEITYNVEFSTPSPDAQKFLQENSSSLKSAIISSFPQDAKLTVTSTQNEPLFMVQTLSTEIPHALKDSKVFTDPSIQLPTTIPLKHPKLEGTKIVVNAKTVAGVKTFDIQIQTSSAKQIDTLNQGIPTTLAPEGTTLLKGIKDALQIIVPSNASLNVETKLDLSNIANTPQGNQELANSLEKNIYNVLTEYPAHKNPNLPLPKTLPLNNPNVPNAQLTISRELVNGLETLSFQVVTPSPKEALALSEPLNLVAEKSSIYIRPQFDLTKLTPKANEQILQSVGDTLLNTLSKTKIFDKSPKLILPTTLPLKNPLLPKANINISKNAEGEFVFNIIGKTPEQTAWLNKPENMDALKSIIQDKANGQPFQLEVSDASKMEIFSKIAQSIGTVAEKVIPPFESLSDADRSQIMPKLNELITKIVPDILSDNKDKPFNITKSLENFPIAGARLNIQGKIDENGKQSVIINVITDSTEGSKFIKEQLSNVFNPPKDSATTSVNSEKQAESPNTQKIETPVSTQQKTSTENQFKTTEKPNTFLFGDMPITIESTPSPKAKTITNLASVISSAIKLSNPIKNESSLTPFMQSIPIDSSILPNTNLKFSLAKSSTGNPLVNIQIDTQSFEAAYLLNSSGSLPSLQNLIQKELGLPPSTTFNFNIDTPSNLNVLSEFTSTITQTMLESAATLNSSGKETKVEIPLPPLLSSMAPDATITIIPTPTPDGPPTFTASLENAPLEIQQLLNKPEYTKAIQSAIQQELLLPSPETIKFKVTLSPIAQKLETEINALAKTIQQNTSLKLPDTKEPIRIPFNKEAFPNTEIVIRKEKGKYTFDIETLDIKQSDTLRNNHPAIANILQNQLQIPAEDIKVNIPSAPSLPAVMKEMVDQIKVSMPNQQGFQEVSIQLKNDVLPGTQIKISMVDGILKVAIETTSAHSQNFLNQNQSSLSNHLQQNLKIETVQVTVQNTSNNEQSDNEGGSRNEYVNAEDEEEKT